MLVSELDVIALNLLSQKDFEDNNISILYSTFNIIKSNQMEEKDHNLDSKNKKENDQQYMKKEKKKKRKKEKKM